MQSGKWWNWFLRIGVPVSFVLASSIVFWGSPATTAGASVLSRILNAVCVISGFVGIVILFVYPLLVRLRLAIQPTHIKNQVKALLNLSKSPDWDANDMGRRLSRLMAWNRENGERLVQGIIWSGFPTRVLEETARREGEDGMVAVIVDCREKVNSDFMLLMLFAPMIALVAFYQTPVFLRAFFSWDLKRQAVLVGILLVLYGKVPIKWVFDLIKGK